MVSIIVPVFNGEKTLSRCIDSVLAQSYTDWELIIVNDGSTDDSYNIIQEYADIYPKITAVHQPNKGVVVARNVGINNAKGNWLAFIDCDDWIEPNMFLQMIGDSKIEADIVWCDVICRGTAETRLIHYEDTPDLIKSLLTTNQHGWLWNKIYRRDFWDKCSVKTDPDCGVLEDSYILMQLYAQHPKVKYVHEPLYNYSINNPSSVTACKYVFGRGIKNIINMLSFLKANDLYESHKKEIETIYVKAKIDLLKMGKYKIIPPRIERHLSAIPVSFPYNLIYWISMNTGRIGRMFFKIYKTWAQ